MFYDDERDEWHESLEEAFHNFAESDIGPAGAPEFLLGSKPMPIEQEWCTSLAEDVMASIDRNIPELCPGDDSCTESFEESVTESGKALLEDLLRVWLKQIVADSSVPDYENKVPFREQYIKWLADLKEEEGENAE